MNRPLKIAAAAALILCLMAGATYAATATTRPVPEKEPQVTIQNVSNTVLPGDMKALEQVMNTSTAVKYKLLVIDATDGEDKTDYLDRVAAQWGEPAADTLLLIVYTQDNYDIRFYMGANFRAKNVSVEEMLQFVRTLYLPKAQVKDAAGGLVDLINAVNQRMGAAAAVTYPDPFGDGARQTAAGQIEIGKALLVGYLDQQKSAAAPEAQRLNEYRFDVNKLNPVEATPDRIVYNVTYDVQPLHPDTYVNAGNGTPGEGGWINGKTLVLTAVKDGKVWRLDSVALGAWHN